MPKCIVEGCYNICNPQSNGGYTSSIRFFTFPKCPLRAKIWKDILNISTIPSNAKVCERHFYDADIKNNNEINLKDGKISRNDHKCYKLKKTAIPKLLNKPLEKVQLNQSVISNHIESNGYSFIQNNTSSQSEVYIANSTNTPFTTSSDRDLKIKSKVDEKYILFDYDFNMIKRDIKRHTLIMPQDWAYIIKDSNIIFTRVDSKKCMIHLFCVIYDNMNVQIVTRDRRVAIDVKLKLSSSKDIYNYLQILSKLYSCEGVGVDSSYAKTCKGFILPTDWEDDKEDFRCHACKKYRTSLLAAKEINGSFIEKELDETNSVIRYKIESLSTKNGDNNQETVFVYY